MPQVFSICSRLGLQWLQGTAAGCNQKRKLQAVCGQSRAGEWVRTRTADPAS